MAKDQFGHIASSYDEVFTHSLIGKFQREIVYQTLEEEGFLNKNQSMFEINCGTGFDAEYFYNKGLKVTATDASEEMISFAKKNRNKNIEFDVLKFEQFGSNYQPSDFVFSNFGGLNCINKDELVKFFVKLSAYQKSKDKIAFVIMPSFCLMESVYFLLKLDLKSIFRRQKKVGVSANVDGIPIKTFYYSPSQIKKMLSPSYSIFKVRPIGLFVPPSYLEPLIRKNSLLFKILVKLDNIFNRISKLAILADHFIIIAEKR